MGGMPSGHSKWKARRGTCGLGQSYRTAAPACLGGVAQVLTWGDVLRYQQSLEFHKFALQYLLEPAAGQGWHVEDGEGKRTRDTSWRRWKHAQHSSLQAVL